MLTDCEMHEVSGEDLVLRGADLRGATLGGLDVRLIDMTDVQIQVEQAAVLLDTIGVKVR